MRSGFLSGYKTYIVGTMAILGAIASYLTGDTTLAESVQLAVTGLVSMTIRAGIKT
jgi:hypothetical protein